MRFDDQVVTSPVVSGIRLTVGPETKEQDSESLVVVGERSLRSLARVDDSSSPVTLSRVVLRCEKGKKEEETGREKREERRAGR